MSLSSVRRAPAVLPPLRSAPAARPAQTLRAGFADDQIAASTAYRRLKDGAAQGRWDEVAARQLRQTSRTPEADFKEAREVYQRYWTTKGAGAIAEAAKGGYWSETGVAKYQEAARQAGVDPKPGIANARKEWLHYWTGGMGLRNLEQGAINQTLTRQELSTYRAACKEAGVKVDERTLSRLWAAAS